MIIILPLVEISTDITPFGFSLINMFVCSISSFLTPLRLLSSQNRIVTPFNFSVTDSPFASAHRVSAVLQSQTETALRVRYGACNLRTYREVVKLNFPLLSENRSRLEVLIILILDPLIGSL